MNYCAACGKAGAKEKVGKLSFHSECRPPYPECVAPRDERVPHISQREITMKRELRTLSGILDMINYLAPRIVKCV